MTGSRPYDASGGPRVAVIGAGVCGLGIGWRLAEAGCHVTVFDRGGAGQGASWAAAGMLAAGVECEPGEEPLLQLTLESQRLWPAFRRELEAASGRTIGYREEGTLVAALNRDDVEELRFNYEFQRGLGIELEWLNGGEARAREPYLRTSAPAAVYSAADHQVDNRLLVLALKEAFLRAGGELQENVAVAAIETAAGHAAGVVVNDRSFAAEAVVLAAGAWSRQIDGLSEALRPPVRPVKGQMLALSMDPAEPLLRHVLWAPRIYMVPRDDGRLIIGATVEERGFDESLTAGGVFGVLEAAWRAVPAIEELPIAEMWVGFRPTSRDDAPILGPGPIEGLYLATGHHRNGILLAPATADYVSRAILEGGVPQPIRGFTLARFQPGQEPPRQAAGGE